MKFNCHISGPCYGKICLTKTQRQMIQRRISDYESLKFQLNLVLALKRFGKETMMVESLFK